MEDFITTRGILYREIWDTSIKKVSEKYGLNYKDLCRFVKDNDIPVPTGRYYSKRNMGIPIDDDIIPLSGDANTIIKLPTHEELLKNRGVDIELLKSRLKRAEETRKLNEYLNKRKLAKETEEKSRVEEKKRIAQIYCIKEPVPFRAGRGFGNVAVAIKSLEPSLGPFVDDIDSIPSIKKSKLEEIIIRAEAGDLCARELLIKTNLKSALRMALNMSMDYGIDITDTVSEACIAVITNIDMCLKLFHVLFKSQNESEEYPHVAAMRNYSRNSLYQLFFKNVIQNHFLIKYRQSEASTYIKAIPLLRANDLLDNNGITEIKKAEYAIENTMGISGELFNTFVSMSRPLMELDALLCSEEEIVDGVYSDDADDVISVQSKNESDITEVDLLLLEMSINSLSEREKIVLLGRANKTLEEMGVELGISRERVRQIQKNAIKKLCY